MTAGLAFTTAPGDRYVLSTVFLRQFLAQGGTGDDTTDQMIRDELARRAGEQS